MSKGRDQCTEFQCVGFLLEINRLMKNGSAYAFRGNVLDKGNPAVFVTDDQILITICIPVDRGRSDHLQMHDQRLAIAADQFDAAGICGFLPTADIFEIGEAIEKFAAE